MSEKLLKLSELLTDDSFAEAVVADTAEETQKNLATKGYDYSLEELKEFAAFFEKSNDGELEEDYLDKVTGGVVYSLRIALRVLSKINCWGQIRR